MIRRMHVGDLLLTGPNLPHEGTGDVADCVLMTGRTLTPGLHEAEPSVAQTCHQAQAGFTNVPHLSPRVFAAKGLPPARVRSLHRSGARFAAAA